MYMNPTRIHNCYAIFRMLRGLAVGYKKVQRRLFDNLDRILNCKGSGRGYENDMGHLITEVFNENSDLCIEILPSQVFATC